MDKIILKFHTTNQKRKIAYKKIEWELTNRPGVLFLSGLASDMEGTKANYLAQWCQSNKKSFLSLPNFYPLVNKAFQLFFCLDDSYHD